MNHVSSQGYNQSGRDYCAYGRAYYKRAGITYISTGGPVSVTGGHFTHSLCGTERAYERENGIGKSYKYSGVRLEDVDQITRAN